MKNQKGFTLIEILIVLSVMGIVVAIASIQMARQEKAGVSTVEEESAAGQILKGEHKLRKMFPSSKATARIAGSYFLFAGNLSSTQSIQTVVTFAWPLKDGTYAISSLPLEKIRVKFDEVIESPTIQFKWTYCSSSQIDYIMANAVLYAVITVQESDWPTQIYLPLNSEPVPAS